jgi:hypothetical protein
LALLGVTFQENENVCQTNLDFWKEQNLLVAP